MRVCSTALLRSVAAALVGLVCLPIPSGAQTMPPAALNVVNLCPYNKDGLYFHVTDVWGVNVGSTHYALATLRKRLSGTTWKAGLAVIDATNIASPNEVLFVSLSGVPNGVDPLSDLGREYENQAVDVETYTKGDTVYAYVARLGGGIQTINLTAALATGRPEVTIADTNASKIYGTLIPRLGRLTNLYPAGHSYVAGSQTHTLNIAGRYLYVGTQTNLVDVWDLEPKPNHPQKKGYVQLAVNYGNQQISGTTRNSDNPGDGTPAQRPSAHELFAQRDPTNEHAARLHVAYTRGGLHVLDVNLNGGTNPSDPRNNQIPPSGYTRAVYDIDRDSVAAADAPNSFDFRLTHSAWPIKNGTYVITTDELGQGFDFAPYINDGGVSITGLDADVRGGFFLRIWRTNQLGTTGALAALYDVPESPTSVGRAMKALNVGSKIHKRSPVPNSVHQVFARGDLVYVAGYTQGVRVLDVSDPENPKEVGYYDPHDTLTVGPTTDPRYYARRDNTNELFNYFAGNYGVFPDPDRPGVVYSSSMKTNGTVGTDAVNFLRYFTGTVDVATIPHNVILSGAFSVPNDVTIAAGATVTVAANSTVSVAANKVIRAQAGSLLKVEPNVTFSMAPNAQLASWGRIEAVGTLTQPVRFQRTNPAAAWSTSNAWREVTLLGNDNHFKHVVFEGGNPNLTVASRNNLFQFCRFKNAWRGLSSWKTLTNGRSQFRIEDSFIESNNTVGLVGYMADVEIKRTTIQNNPQTAVTLQSSADITELNYSRSTGNAGGGLYLSSGSDVYMPPYGLNRLYNDGGPELTIPYGGYVSGLDYSRSSIFHTSGSPPSGAYVVNNSGATLYANETYWGGGAPLASWFSPSGSVYAPNPLTSEWATGAGPGGSVPLSRGVEGPVLTMDGAVSAADDARRWVRDHVDDPSAPARLWALYGSHRRPGATGNVAAERSADADLFVDLAGRLDGGRSLTGAARRTSETATALAVRTAMKDGRYDDARALVDRHLPRVESADVARALRFDRVTLLGLQDRTDEALELLAALEAERPEDPAPRMIRETLASTAWIRALAETDAASETEGLRTTRTPAGLPDVFEATSYPNPTRGRAVVRYALPEAGPARVEVFDALGRRVAQLADGPHAAGRYEAALDVGTLPAGLYLWRVAAGDRVRTGRVVLVR